MFAKTVWCKFIWWMTSKKRKMLEKLTLRHNDPQKIFNQIDHKWRIILLWSLWSLFSKNNASMAILSNFQFFKTKTKVVIPLNVTNELWLVMLEAGHNLFFSFKGIFKSFKTSIIILQQNLVNFSWVFWIFY